MKQWVLKTFTVFSSGIIIAGCTQHKVDTTHKVELEVKPMHITIDVNLKVDRELDDFFGDIDKQNETMKEEK